MDCVIGIAWKTCSNNGAAMAWATGELLGKNEVLWGPMGDFVLDPWLYHGNEQGILILIKLRVA